MRSPSSLGRLPWWVDIVGGLLIVALYVTEYVQWGGDEITAGVGGFVLAGVSISLRRVAPLAAIVLCGASVHLVTSVSPGFDNESAALVISFFVCLFSVGRHTDGLERWLGAGAVLVLTILFFVGDAQGDVKPGDVVFATVFVGAPWLAGLTLRIRHDREHTWRARTEALRAEQDERERRAVTAERSRIARELHDVVSHAIAVTVLQARGARKMLGVDEPSVRRALDAIDQTNTQALGDMRRLLALLRDTEDNPLASPQPTLDEIPALVEQVRESGLPVDAPGQRRRRRGAARGRAVGLPHRAGGADQRHQARRARAPAPRSTSGTARRRSSSPSPTTAAARSRALGQGHGLVGIRERVAVVGGRVEAGPRESGGFAVSVRLPYAVEA